MAVNGRIYAGLRRQALNILLCNDDGISAANMRALKQQLQAVGHSVIVAAPIDNQSGRGGYIAFLQPVPALSGNERSAMLMGLPVNRALRAAQICSAGGGHPGRK